MKSHLNIVNNCGCIGNVTDEDENEEINAMLGHVEDDDTDEDEVTVNADAHEEITAMLAVLPENKKPKKDEDGE